MIKTALVGFGAAARNIHLPLIQNQPEMDIVAVLSSKPENVEKVLGNVPCFSDYHQLVTNSSAQLFIITTPNKMHYRMAMDALLAGKDVVVEKPVAVDAKDAASLQAIAQQQNKQLLPFHNRRWDGDFLTVKRLIENGQFGEVKLFESRFDRFRPKVSDNWKEQDGQQSGLWFDLGPHLLDQAFELFGQPTAITARLLCTRREAKATDYFHVQLHYQNREVVLSASNHCPGPVRRFYIEGTKASFSLTGLDPQGEQLEKGITPNSPGYGISDANRSGQLYSAAESTDITTTTITKRRGAWQDYYQAVTDCLLRKIAFPVTVESALQVAKYLQLAVLSQQQNKTIWVRQYRD